MIKLTKLRFTWVLAFFLTFGFLCGASALANEENETAGAGYDPAQQQLEDALADVAANRTAFENDLAQRCAPAWGEDVDNAVAALAGLNDADLLAADEAPDCDAARSIIEGEPVELLGDTTQDWVYTAVDPCIIVDTRNVGGPIFSGTQRNFFVFGALGSQGGAVCNLPSGKPEPRGVHINLIAIPVGGKGNVRAFPYLNPTTDGLSANFQTANDVNVANAGTIKSCYLCGPEITVRSSNGSAHVKIEILGYYFPADNPDGSDWAQSGQSLALSPTATTVRSVAITAPSSGKVIVNASGSIGFNSTARDSARCCITTGTALDTNHLIIAAEETGGPNTVRYMPFGSTRGFNVSAGTTTFRLVCDEFAGNVTVVDSSMTAIFTRNTR